MSPNLVKIYKNRVNVLYHRYSNIDAPQDTAYFIYFA